MICIRNTAADELTNLSVALYMRIILEERGKMRKKILDALSVFVFSLCLIVLSNIQEITVASLGSPNSILKCFEIEDAMVTLVCDENSLTAGVCSVIPKQSFTTESDDVLLLSNLTEIGVEKNDTVVVTTPVYTNRWNIELTEEEIDLLAKIVWLEARGESVEGQEAVVEVVLNRMASDLYPDTLYDVLSQKHPVQFSSWKNREKASPTETEYQSIYNVLNGNTNLLRDDTLYFSTFMMTKNLDVQIGNHYFCYQ